jgi:phytoene dehydrogenase-like protein
MKKKVIIIGAGISGLSAGCYLQMNGYETEIYELHSLPGGLCTAWQRKGYTIDGCIHWLVGSNPGNDFYGLWNELIDMKNVRFFEYDEYLRIEDADGKGLTVFTDIDKLEREMLDKAPEDRQIIVEFIGAVKKVSRFKMPIGKAQELYGFCDKVKLLLGVLPYMRVFKKWINITGAEFAARCKNPLLRKTFESMFVSDMAALFLVFTMAWMNKKSAGYPMGGSLEFARRIENKYLELGGRINYGSKVTRIITGQDNDADTAKGVVLENGKTHSADIVISAADGHFTIFEMLGGKYRNDKIKSYYENYATFSSYLQVSFGLSRTFEGVSNAIIYELKKPIVIDSSTQKGRIGFRIFNFDPTLAPKGKTVVTAFLTTRNYEYWEDLRRNNREKYNAEKERIAAEVIGVLEEKMGNIKNHVEMTDISTPATVMRYTNNWKGSLEGWLLSPKVGFTRMSKTLPGLDNFYMIGQWVEPGGGLPPAIQSGRNVAQIICTKDKKRFSVI